MKISETVLQEFLEDILGEAVYKRGEKSILDRLKDADEKLFDKAEKRMLPDTDMPVDVRYPPAEDKAIRKIQQMLSQANRAKDHFGNIAPQDISLKHY